MLLVLGVGIVGKAVIETFHDVCFFDDTIKEIAGVPFFSSWDEIEKIIASPGVPLDHHMIQEAVRRNIPVTNDIGLFLDLNLDGIKIGITGSNGKSSTCALLKHILGEEAELGGNFGYSPLLFKKNKYYVIELSSFQLEVLATRQINNLDFGLITNIIPTHIARHGSFDDYVCAKSRILGAKKKAVFEDEFFQSWEVDKVKLEERFPESIVFDRFEYKASWSLVKYVLENLNFDLDIAFERAKTYKPLPHRQEVVCTDPVLVINDSKASNPGAVLAAFKNMQSDFVWIAGGSGIADWENVKESDFGKVAKVFVIGENVKEFLKVLKQNNLNFEYMKTIEEAVPISLNFAKTKNLPILLSPGYPSHDQFKNFEERGLCFSSLIKKHCS